MEEAQHQDEATITTGSTTTRSGSPKTLLLGIAALVIGILVGNLLRPLAASPRSDQVPAASARAADPVAGQTTLMDTAIAQTRHFKGEPNASITIIEFSDFQCPFCGRFANGALRQIDQTYIQKGLVRFGFQPMIFLGDESGWAAEASECAADQDAFWNYHDLLFEQQAGENQGAFTKDHLKGFAADLRLDAARFNACLDTGKYAQLIRDQTVATQPLGVHSTPTFIVNGQRLLGAQPFEVFQRLIEAERKH